MAEPDMVLSQQGEEEHPTEHRPGRQAQQAAHLLNLRLRLGGIGGRGGGRRRHRPALRTGRGRAEAAVSFNRAVSDVEFDTPRGS